MKDMRKNALGMLRKNLRAVGEELPVKKVSVMADSEEGLKQGLEKAEDILEGEMGEEQMNSPEGMEQQSEMEDMESEEKDYSDEALAMMSREELIDCIKKMRDSELED